MKEKITHSDDFYSPERLKHAETDTDPELYDMI